MHGELLASAPSLAFVAGRLQSATKHADLAEIGATAPCM
jgi:hypothetical protein